MATQLVALFKEWFLIVANLTELPLYVKVQQVNRLRQIFDKSRKVMYFQLF